MNILLEIKKIGNHWYPNLKHNSLDELALSPKIEKVLSKIDKDNTGNVRFLIYETNSWTNNSTFQFNEEDMWRWINTTDLFDLTVYLRDYEYEISSSIIDLLEDQYNMAFYNTLYSIELSDI